jgi:hypothetical protein
MAIERVPEFMAKLIVKGFEENPIKTPSIEDIVDVFEAYKFKVLIRVNTATVETFVKWVDDD